MILRIAWTLKQVRKKKISIDNENVKGYFIWIGSCGVVDRIVGYHFKRGWIADTCYYTGNHWIKDLWRSIISRKGFLHITRYI